MSMLDNCWRRLSNWAPDPALFACERQWFGARPKSQPSAWAEAPLLRAPCFRTCWLALGKGAHRRHCSASCDGNETETAASLPPSPQPPHAQRAALLAVLELPPSQFYAEDWAARARPRLIQALGEPVSRYLHAKLDWSQYEVLSRPPSRRSKTSWPPEVWNQPATRPDRSRSTEGARSR